MSTQSDDRERSALLQGTLDLLILRTLVMGPEHGQGIARTIQQRSDDAILVEHGSLYPALQRLEAQRLIQAEWGVSDNGRRARFYQLTPRGRKHLTAEASRWRALTTAIGRVLGPALAEG
ncbi:MAG TPA: PadR family transcriptional regulator [Gemmatimonadales bacterium]|jgi:transcriptional regulator|nr:PadR family transcriptional regulator [Gemmatimonadales bacterium]